METVNKKKEEDREKSIYKYYLLVVRQIMCNCTGTRSAKAKIRLTKFL